MCSTNAWESTINPKFFGEGSNTSNPFGPVFNPLGKAFGKTGDTMQHNLTKYNIGSQRSVFWDSERYADKTPIKAPNQVNASYAEGVGGTTPTTTTPQQQQAPKNPSSRTNLQVS